MFKKSIAPSVSRLGTWGKAGFYSMGDWPCWGWWQLLGSQGFDPVPVQDYIERMSTTWTSGSSLAACNRFCRGGEEEGQAGWAQHKKAIFPLMNVVNALGNPVLAMRDCHYETQCVNTLYIFRAYLFVMPFEKF